MDVNLAALGQVKRGCSLTGPVSAAERLAREQGKEWKEKAVCRARRRLWVVSVRFGTQGLNLLHRINVWRQGAKTRGGIDGAKSSQTLLNCTGCSPQAGFAGRAQAWIIIAVPAEGCASLSGSNAAVTSASAAVRVWWGSTIAPPGADVALGSPKRPCLLPQVLEDAKPKRSCIWEVCYVSAICWRKPVLAACSRGSDDGGE